MKIDENYILKTIAGTPVVMPVGEAAEKIHGMIKLTPSASHIWQALSEGKDYDEVVSYMTALYPDTDPARIKADLDGFINKLRDMGILTD